VDESRDISEEMVREIAADLQFEQNYWNTDEPSKVTEEGHDQLVPDAVIVSGHEEELFLMLKKLSFRVEQLESRVSTASNPEEIPALVQRTDALEDALRELWRVVQRIASEPQAAGGAQVSGEAARHEPPPLVSPKMPQRKGIFQSLFGRS
jgi:hypothetical protein